jgi:hypothetical protein
MSDEYEYGTEPDWRGHDASASEHDFDASVKDLLSKCQIRITRCELLVPFAHNSAQCYRGGIVYEVRPGDWRIEDRPGRFKNAAEALAFLAESIEIDRHKMLNEEFQKDVI